MDYELDQATEVLARTPATVRALLSDLPDPWTRSNEGGETWSPFDVLGHLIHGERTDWIERARIILEHGETRTFDPFDRFAQFEESKGKTLAELLDEFEALRAANLEALRGLDLSAEDLARTGRHPDFGVVTMRNLLSTWVVHDLGHIGQIVRVLARQYRSEVGPWRAYVPVLAARD